MSGSADPVVVNVRAAKTRPVAVPALSSIYPGYATIGFSKGARDAGHIRSRATKPD